MNNKFALTKEQARPLLTPSFPYYKGRKISVVFCESMTLQDVQWSGGSKNEYVFLAATEGGVYGKKLYPNGSPFHPSAEGAEVDLSQGVVVAEHCYFCGKDLGVRFYAHTSLAPRLLGEGPAKAFGIK